MYIVEILMNANAKQYLPMFARKKVTRKQMDAMTHDELNSVSQFRLLRMHKNAVEFDLVVYIAVLYSSFSCVPVPVSFSEHECVRQ